MFTRITHINARIVWKCSAKEYLEMLDLGQITPNPENRGLVGSSNTLIKHIMNNFSIKDIGVIHFSRKLNGTKELVDGHTRTIALQRVREELSSTELNKEILFIEVPKSEKTEAFGRLNTSKSFGSKEVLTSNDFSIGRFIAALTDDQEIRKKFSQQIASAIHIMNNQSELGIDWNKDPDMNLRRIISSSADVGRITKGEALTYSPDLSNKQESWLQGALKEVEELRQNVIELAKDYEGGAAAKRMMNNSGVFASILVCALMDPSQSRPILKQRTLRRTAKVIVERAEGIMQDQYLRSIARHGKTAQDKFLTLAEALH